MSGKTHICQKSRRPPKPPHCPGMTLNLSAPSWNDIKLIPLAAPMWPNAKNRISGMDTKEIYVSCQHFLPRLPDLRVPPRRLICFAQVPFSTAVWYKPTTYAS